MCEMLSLKSIYWPISIFVLIMLTISSLATNMGIISKSVNTSDESISYLADHLSKQYAIEYINFLKNGKESFQFLELKKQLLNERSNKSWAQGFRNVTDADELLACIACRAVAQGAAHILRDPNNEWNGIDKERYVQRFFMEVCGVFHLLQQEVCRGYFGVFWPIFEYVVQKSPTFDERSFCNRLGIGFCNIRAPNNNWVLTMNDGVPNHSWLTAKGKPTLGFGGEKILQITDIHYDPDYKVGALANCEDEPLCCQRMPVKVSVKNKRAGYWGDYHVCDAPLRLIENAFNHMRRRHQDIQYIYHTGDVLPHTGWKTNRADVVEKFTHIDKLMTEKFPGIPVFPCIGNNDVYPSDLSSPSDVPMSVNTKWLYARLYAIWSKHLPYSTSETILKGGYYTVSPHVGFRIISLNSNECRLNNIWLYFNSSFPMEQLQWLHDTLLLAEQSQEYVHILSHTPIGSAECWQPWSQEYFRLLERFRHIVKGIFYGHSHTNDMSVHYDSKGNAMAVGWHGGSLTTFVGRNPSYRVYKAEYGTMRIVDLETWSFNLSLANNNDSNQEPSWFRLSNFTEDFTADLSPTGVDSLLERMATDSAVLRKYWRLKKTASEPMLLQGCDERCLRATLCGSINNPTRCRLLKDKLSKSLLKEAAVALNGSTMNTVGSIKVFLFSFAFIAILYKSHLI